MNEQGRRNSAITAEIVFSSPGNPFGFNLNPTLSLTMGEIDGIRKIPGVRAAVPLGQNIRTRMVDGIDFNEFQQVSDLRVVEGRPIASGDEAIVDRLHASRNKVRVGDTINVLDREFTIVGIYEPETLGRIKVPLSTLQHYLNREDRCSHALVKVADGASVEDVAARIQAAFPDNKLLLTRDLPILYAQGTPALQTFLKVVIALAAIISSLVILLTMYTTVTERTRQIGVLKSLGASKFWIAGEIEKEALLISAIGVVVGFALSVAGKLLITRLTAMSVDLEPAWLLYALVIGMAGGVLGALYPALRAANQDPVTALAYE
jgi:putative ABC transport system permease protein